MFRNLVDKTNKIRNTTSGKILVKRFQDASMLTLNWSVSFFLCKYFKQLHSIRIISLEDVMFTCASLKLSCF